MNTHKTSNSAPPTERSIPRPIRTFLADDNPFMLTWLAQALERDDRVSIVASATIGHKAFQEAIMSEPDLVLIDLHMPGMNAADVIRWLKQIHDPPVVFVVTSDAAPESRGKSLAAGADTFLIKDECLPGRLQAAIQKFFGNHSEEQVRKPFASCERATQTKQTP